MNRPRAIRRRPAAEPPGDFPAGLHPVMARVYAARRVASASELEISLARLIPFEGLLGIDAAVTLIEQALRGGRRILVIGDFDADGATSTALALRALRLMGAEQVDFLVPDRFRDGYGLSPEIVAVAAERRPDLLITVDNGISSNAGVAAAKARGMRVLVTDHHLPGRELPEADAIVDPNQPGCGFPSKALAGVGVIFYLMLGLRARLRECGWFAERAIGEVNLAQFLDLVALGTVADVAHLDANNRLLVAQGIARMRAGRCSAGIAALAEVAQRPLARLVSSDLGFSLGPRLNAAGRLDDMALGIRCLLSDDREEALELARQLDRLNRERRAIEAAMQEEALTALQGMESQAASLCLYRPEFHQGVIGNLASRLREKTNRPVVVFADGGEGELKGSARSVPGFHLRDALEAIATGHPGLLTRFGGHAMAAGLGLPRHEYDRFRAAFEGEVTRRLGVGAERDTLFTDGELQPHELSIDLARHIRDGGPWGQGFPEPLFDNEFEVTRWRVVGERHLRLELRLPGEKAPIDAIHFNGAEQWSEPRGRVRAVYRLDLNEFRGQESRQLVIEHIEAAEVSDCHARGAVSAEQSGAPDQ